MPSGLVTVGENAVPKPKGGTNKVEGQARLTEEEIARVFRALGLENQEQRDLMLQWSGVVGLYGTAAPRALRVETHLLNAEPGGDTHPIDDNGHNP